MKSNKTKIIATIGPASEDENVLKTLLLNGVNICRLNFSHGTYENHLQKINKIKKLREELNLPISILLDTKGPEIRTGTFVEKEITLTEGNEFSIYMNDITGDATKCSVSYHNLINDVKPGDKILIDDGIISMIIISKHKDFFKCKIENGGIIKEHKGVNVPNVNINLPALGKTDKADLMFGIENKIDTIAASFIRKAGDVLEIKKFLKEHNGENIRIVAKIENKQGVENIDEILKVADGIMIARGDLGVEVPAEDVPIIQKKIIKKCNNLSKPVITATQMLDSMIRNISPTRAEVTDVANAIYDGTDAIMLSGETASGKHPVEAVQTMKRIALKTESTIDYNNIADEKALHHKGNITNAISHATCDIAKEIKAEAIITCTKSGYTAFNISSYRPKQPIIAIVSDLTVYYQMAHAWGVIPLYEKENFDKTDALFNMAINSTLSAKMIKSGDSIVITAGVPIGESGSTNIIKVHVVSKILSHGIGYGHKTIIGKASSIENFETGNILVISDISPEYTEYISKASCVIIEEDLKNEMSFISAFISNKVVITGAKSATKKIKDGDYITVDPVKGYIYEGKVSII